ncbi:hypothetical protein HPB47_001301 [Ixodes persulcatus]|uniref:Uncharacterized protein n=1 Tax=Ixodes persulcatus TaxID=34615 RepID=A0AC60PRA1_IXOPE|nr:hypothetical protein HPB47_001301 [Ixodes persulcatus]
MDRLRRTRGVVRSAVSRTLAQIDALLENPDSTEVRAHSHWKRIRDEVEGAEEYRLRISTSLTRLHYTLDTFAANAQPRLPEAPPVNPPSTATIVRSHRTVALPKLQDPMFAGNLRDWQGFWDHLNVTIHANPDLPPIEKFKYLMTYQQTTLNAPVEGIRLSDQNYELAVRTLQDRFGRRDILIDDHIDQLLNLPVINTSSDVAKLRQLHDAIRFRTTSLEGLDVPPSSYAVVLHRVLMRCLPADLAILYRQKLRESTPPSSTSTPDLAPEDQVNIIMRFLRIQVEIREDGQIDRASYRFRRGLSQTTPQESVSANHPSTLALSTESEGYRSTADLLWEYLSPFNQSAASRRHKASSFDHLLPGFITYLFSGDSDGERKTMRRKSSGPKRLPEMEQTLPRGLDCGSAREFCCSAVGQAPSPRRGDGWPPGQPPPPSLPPPPPPRPVPAPRHSLVRTDYHDLGSVYANNQALSTRLQMGADDTKPIPEEQDEKRSCKGALIDLDCDCDCVAPVCRRSASSPSVASRALVLSDLDSFPQPVPLPDGAQSPSPTL